MIHTPRKKMNQKNVGWWTWPVVVVWAIIIPADDKSLLFCEALTPPMRTPFKFHRTYSSINIHKRHPTSPGWQSTQRPISIAGIFPSTTFLWASPANATTGVTAAVTTTRTKSPHSNNNARHRLDRTATRDVVSRCVLHIDGAWYNLTAWAKAHPGGVKVLQQLHGRDATQAFDAAAHSTAAWQMLKKFEVPEAEVVAQGLSLRGTTTTTKTDTRTSETTTNMMDATTSSLGRIQQQRQQRPRWQQKLFTQEDPIGIHKYLGLFCLLNFAYRYSLLYWGDPAGGFGQTSLFWPAFLSLVPHAVLSLSSLLFHTVPRERVVGKPMIWQEYRIHNIAFGVRSVLCGMAAILATHASLQGRTAAVAASCGTALMAMLVADYGTRRFQPSALESTTATMPYWEGCSIATQKQFKLFYAYSQFMATLACIAVANPAWPFCVMWAIQGASLLMTLVRKGIISAKAYHMGYTVMLAMPYVVGFRNGFVTGGGAQHLFFPSVMGLAGLLFTLRRRGVNKYALWIPVLVARVVVGDKFIPYQMW